MGKRRKSLTELLAEKLLLLLTAGDALTALLIGAEKSIFSAVLASLRSFSLKSGKLVSDEGNRRLMADITRNTKKVVRGVDLTDTINAFLPKFDEVDTLNEGIYKQIVGTGATFPDSSPMKELAIQQLISAFDDLKGLESGFEIPLRRRLFEAVTLNMELNAAVEYLRAYIVGETEAGGNLAHYGRTIAKDLLNGYTGYADWQIAKANGLDGFYFTGPLVKNSRQTCIDMVNGSGEFEELAIEPGLFAVDDIPKIVDLAKDNKGFRPETTAETYPIFRNGYNCEHLLVFVPLSNAEKETRARVKEAVENGNFLDPGTDNSGS